VYGTPTEPSANADQYILPENLRLFFEGQDRSAYFTKA